jgi:hypothetical protein
MPGTRQSGYFGLMPLKELAEGHRSELDSLKAAMRDEEDPRAKRVYQTMLRWVNFHAEGNGDTFALDTSVEPHPVVFNQHDWNDGGDGTNGFLLGKDLNDFMTRWGTLCFQRPRSLWWLDVRKDHRVDWESDEFSNELTIAALASSEWIVTEDPGHIARRRLSDLIIAGDLKGVRQAIARGVKPESRNDDGETALHEAVIHGHPPIVEFLIHSGADVNIRDKDGATPLMTASMYAEAECLEMLLQRGADANAVDGDGLNALKHLCPIHGTPEMKKLLKKYMKK